MIQCPACDHDLPEETLECPHCGEILGPPQKASVDETGTIDMTPFKGVDPSLYDQIDGTVAEDAWPLSVMAEIVNYHVGELSKFLNDAPDVQNSLFSFVGDRWHAKKLKRQFNEFVHVVADFQDVFRRDMPRAIASRDTKDLKEFHIRLGEALQHLLDFHRQVAGLRLVRSTLSQKMQSQMLDWVQHLLVCLERLEKQMRRKSGFSPTRLAAMSVQVSFSPPTLPLFFRLMNELDG